MCCVKYQVFETTILFLSAIIEHSFEHFSTLKMCQELAHAYT